MENNNDNTQKAIKPKTALKLTGNQPSRVVSTGYDNTSTLSSQISKDKSIKLNENAVSFIPKAIREKQAESTHAPVEGTLPTPTGTNIPMGSIPYPTSKILFNLDPALMYGQATGFPINPNSMIGSTYLNAHIQGQHYYPPNAIPQRPYAPNFSPGATGQFFPPSYAPYAMSNPPKMTMPPLENSSSNLVIQMNTDSKPWAPKSKVDDKSKTTERKEEDTEKPKEDKENVDKEKTLQKETVEKEKEKEIVPIQEKIETPKEVKPEPKENEAPAEKQEPSIKADPVKVEKAATRLKDLLDNKESSVNKSLKKTSSQPVNVVQNIPGIAQKPAKKDDIKKAIDQKLKKAKELGVVNPPQHVPAKPVRDQRQEKIIEETKIQSEEKEDQDLGDKVEESKPSLKIERHYFIVDESESSRKIKHAYDMDYLLNFRNWKISQETTLLSRMVLDHLESMKTFEEDFKNQGYNKNQKNRPNVYQDKNVEYNKNSDYIKKSSNYTEDKDKFGRGSLKPEVKPVDDKASLLKEWGRKDTKREDELAQEFKKKLEEQKKIDPVSYHLRELLNILTVDNYEETRSNIFELIKSDVNDQYKFLDVLFKKAVHEKTFVYLYAKLCKDLDKDLPQKSEREQAKIKASLMRKRLVERCKEIFKNEDNAQLEKYINVTDPDEREIKLKKFLLGNVNFIGELINTQTLSKKIVFQCISNLFGRIEKNDSDKLLKQINIEAIVILIDKFGTLINIKDKKIKPEDLAQYNAQIDLDLEKLDQTQMNDKSLPGHVRYRIINLISKRNEGWEESKYEKTSLAKGKDQVRTEFEYEQKNVTAIKGNFKKLDQDTVISRIRDDLYSWKDHLKSGGDRGNYSWEITEALIKQHKNTLGEIITAFSENAIDFLQKYDDLELGYKYIREVIVYYSKRLNQNERNEIVEVVIQLLTYLNDMALDNHLLIDIWGGIIYILENNKVMPFSELDRMTDLGDEQLECIFSVVAVCLSYYDNKKEEKLNDLMRVNLIKEHEEQFMKAVNKTENK